LPSETKTGPEKKRKKSLTKKGGGSKEERKDKPRKSREKENLLREKRGKSPFL